jgi:hypothetical protein
MINLNELSGKNVELRQLNLAVQNIHQSLRSYNFNVHESVHRNSILVYKFQQDAQVTEFIFI